MTYAVDLGPGPRGRRDTPYLGGYAMDLGPGPRGWRDTPYFGQVPPSQELMDRYGWTEESIAEARSTIGCRGDMVVRNNRCVPNPLLSPAPTDGTPQFDVWQGTLPVLVPNGVAAAKEEALRRKVGGAAAVLVDEPAGGFDIKGALPLLLGVGALMMFAKR